MGDHVTKKVGVVLSGCGVYDGSEIHEATLTLLALDQAGAQITCLAPDVNQFHVIDHLTGNETGEQRNVRMEAARIARGDVLSMSNSSPDDFDALIFPGGYGAAKNLFTFAIDGVDGTVNADVERFILTMHAKGKPQGFICITPVIAAKVLGEHQPELTIGTDEGTAAAIVKMGGRHIIKAVDEIAIDERNMLVSTPAYMLGPSIAHVAKGITKLVQAVLDMA